MATKYAKKIKIECDIWQKGTFWKKWRQKLNSKFPNTKKKNVPPFTSNTTIMSLPQNDNHRHLINAPPTAIRVMNTGRSTKGGRSVPSLPRRRRIRSEDEDYSTDEGSSSSRTSESTEEDTEEESRNSTTKDVDGATAMRLAGMGNSRTLKEVQHRALDFL